MKDMDRHFFVEAKSFAVSVKEGEAVVRLEESRKGFVSKVSLGLQCTAWPLSMVEVALLWCRTIFIFIFGKNENKENIKNNIGATPLDQNFIRS